MYKNFTSIDKKVPVTYKIVPSAEEQLRDALRKAGYRLLVNTPRHYIIDSKGRSTGWYIFCGCLKQEWQNVMITFKLSECEVESTKEESDTKDTKRGEGKIVVALKNKISSVILS